MYKDKYKAPRFLLKYNQSSWLHLLVLLLLPFSLWAQNPLDERVPKDTIYTPWRGHFDIDLLDKLNPDPPRSIIEKQISNSAYWLPPAIILGELSYGLIDNNKEYKRYALETTLSVGLGQGISYGLKYLLKRPRPYMSYPDRIHPVNFSMEPSFPSGHTTLAFSTATALALTKKQWTVTLPISLWAGAVGHSRMYLGRHFPTDVLGGIASGIAGGLLSHWVTGRIYGD